MAKKSSKKPAPKKKARKAAPPPAAWYRRLDKNKKAAQVDYLSRTVKDLRQYFTGFTSSDGYDLRHVERWQGNRLRAIKMYGAHLHSMQAVPHVRVVKPRSKKKAAALDSFTGQIYGGTKKARAYLVQVESEKVAKSAKVSVTDEGQVRVERRIKTKKGGYAKLIDQYYLFRDYGFNPGSFLGIDDVIKATKYMIKHAMPPGTYTLQSVMHGSIWNPLERDEILLNLRKVLDSGGSGRKDNKGFASSLLGWKYQGDEFRAEAEFIAREQRRRARDRQKRALRALAEKRFTKWRQRKGLSKRPKRKPTKRKPKKKVARRKK